MDDLAKLITALGAIAWPTIIAMIVYYFRTEIRSMLSKIPLILDRTKKLSVLGIDLELDRVANEEVRDGKNKSGEITLRQKSVAARIKLEAREISPSVLLRELDRLCLEYDSLRRLLPSGEARTLEMTRIIVKMRSLAPSLIGFLDVYKGSASPGSRLAAITMMQ